MVSLRRLLQPPAPSSSLLGHRNPNPFITSFQLSCLMRLNLPAANGDNSSFSLSLDDSVVKSASEKAFRSLLDISKAISELTVLKGVVWATISAVLAVYAPEVSPFMSDEVGFWDVDFCVRCF
ncbi:uncharacterized protein [Pyrus communis]|uniref:uncharacterized protein n=1 Tax=Pyrus communis TaxID=23211 RepID=UPI0035C0360A